MRGTDFVVIKREYGEQGEEGIRDYMLRVGRGSDLGYRSAVYISLGECVHISDDFAPLRNSLII